MTAVLECKGLSKRYGSLQALADKYGLSLAK